MVDDREFRIRPGRIRSTRAQAARPFIAQALAAAKKAGGGVSRSGRVTSGSRSRFGHGQRASIQANRHITARSRGALVKARVVRHSARAAPLGTHLDYLRRDGVTREGEKARLFGPGEDEADGRAFAERCEDDRHHFRFIVSPDDALEMSDLRSFTSDLVGQMEKDLGTELDWVAVDHWNTEHPHVHLIVRGLRDDGEDLVISRDYIKEGMRDRARDLITQELGASTIDQVEKAFFAEIERMARGGVSPAELEKAKRQLEVRLVEGLSTAHSLASRVGNDYVFLGRVRSLDERLASIQAVSAEDVQRVVAQYLVQDKRSVVQLVSSAESGAASAGEGQ